MEKILMSISGVATAWEIKEFGLEKATELYSERESDRRKN